MAVSAIVVLWGALFLQFAALLIDAMAAYAFVWVMHLATTVAITLHRAFVLRKNLFYSLCHLAVVTLLIGDIVLQIDALIVRVAGYTPFFGWTSTVLLALAATGRFLYLCLA